MAKEKQTNQEYDYAKLAMKWSGWASPIGFGIGLIAIGVFLWMLHLANIIK